MNKKSGRVMMYVAIYLGLGVLSTLLSIYMNYDVFGFFGAFDQIQVDLGTTPGTFANWVAHFSFNVIFWPINFWRGVFS